jgi:S-DNA-T family DNA segregation ATPase FtsK/SpoIIIE
LKPRQRPADRNNAGVRTTITVVSAARAVREDVLVEASAATPSGQVVDELAALMAADPSEPVLVDGNPIDPLAPLAASGVREGSIVSFDGRQGPDRSATTRTDEPARDVQPRGYLELRIVGGPSAGGIAQLRPGETMIGRSPTCAVVLDDLEVSRRHATLTITSDTVTVADAGSTNGTTLNGQPVGAHPISVSPGARLRVGNSTLMLAPPDEPPVTLAPGPDNRLGYNRAPRLHQSRSTSRVDFPAEPAERAPTRLPVIATVAPLAAGVVLALVMRRPEYLLFTVLSPVMMAGQWLADRVGHRRAKRAALASYGQALAVARAELAALLTTEVAERRKAAPDLAAVLKIATAPGLRLWERRRIDSDFLSLRLGLGTLPADIETANGPAAPQVDDVPVTIALGTARVVGIAGPPAKTAGLGRSLAGQLASLHSPNDVAIVLLAEPARAQSWQWIRWLPHNRPAMPTGCQALVGIDSDTCAARVAELNALINARQENREHATNPRRTVVVIVDGARTLRSTPGFADLLIHGPDADVLAICLDSNESRLPEECVALATFDDDVATTLSLRISGAPVITGIVADTVTVSWAERVARALAPIRDASSSTGAQALPDTVRWFELADLDDAADSGGLVHELSERWQRSGGGSTRVLLGAGRDGVFGVDLAHDGPHALIAGTTGSGKSELLQTLVASLAIANRPDELTFVLVDYKGGAAFGACSSLPHTVGLVTDLDGSLVERALVSLSAELKRRESLLATAGAVNIEAYRRSGGTMARLVIAVDEFASLAEELPDFVGGLVGIAQRGRSLGVHLVLATQRPEGVVSADIRANTNLRICLAVMRDTESRDVIDTADAARISRATPGRGFVRTGHGELHAFQCGRVGGAAPAGASIANERGQIDVRLAPFRSLALPEPLLRPAACSDEQTDLDLVVAACRASAIHLDIKIPQSPWLPPLPAIAVGPTHVDEPLTATVGVRDVPSAQAREPFILNFQIIGHLVVAGSARSGRTTALRTMAGLLARSTSTRDLHMYALDCGGGSLAALSALPHCGAVVSTHEPDRARRLVSILTGELTRRQTLLATNGFGSIAEQRAAGQSPLPHIVVFVDTWEPFVTAFDDVDSGSVVDGMFRLLREGAAVGIHVVAASDRAGLVGRLASSVDSRLVLRLADRGDFSLIGLPPRAIPNDLPAGRGFLAGDLTQTHIYLLDPDPAGAAQLTALATIAANAAARDTQLPPTAHPCRVDPLPERVTLPELNASERHGGAQVTIGVGGDALGAISVDLLDPGPGFVIAGPPRSGRSTALATVATSLRHNGWRVIGVSARPSPIAAYVDEAFEATDLALELALDQNLSQPIRQAIGGAGHAGTPLAVVVDDAELVTDTPAAGVLDRFMRAARDRGHIMAVAGTTDDLSIGFRGFIVDARRARTGVLLTPRSALDGEALGIRLPRDTGGRWPPGRGLLVSRGVACPLQLALPA